MYRAIDVETGDIVYLERAIIETDCPQCRVWHQIDLIDLLLSGREDFSFEDTRVYCASCTEKRRKKPESNIIGLFTEREE